MPERNPKIEFQSVFPITGDCRYCHKPLLGKQTSWCSKLCQESAWADICILRGSSKYVRKALKKRDKEICAACNRDCNLTKRVIDHAGTSINHLIKNAWTHQLEPEYYILRYFGFIPFKHTWEADHIIEVRDGGSNELSNFQTLCIPCHKIKTKTRPFFN